MSDAPLDRELAQASAALDGEARPVADPSPETQRFLVGAEELRRSVRVAAIDAMPDLSASVLAVLDSTAAPRRRWQSFVAVAAAFAIGVGAAAVFLLDRDLASTELAAAELSELVDAAQADLTELDATVVITERGVHPDVPERQYEGRLRYRAPEQLHLAIRDITERPEGWPANDVELVVDEDVAWRTRRLACPVDELPGCLAPVAIDGIAHRPPFSAGWAAPLDLVVPAETIVATPVGGSIRDGRIVVETTVADATQVIASTIDSGAFRQVHADDRIELRLDEATSTLAGFSVFAADTTARRLWATTWGYTDEPGSEVFRMDLTMDDDGVGRFAPPNPPDGLADAGFVDSVGAPFDVGAALPAGFLPHRQGTTRSGSAELFSWADGRAWVTVRIAGSTSTALPVGAEPVTVGDSTIYVDRPVGEVLVLAPTQRVRVAGSVTLDELVRIAIALPVTGRPGEVSTGLPAENVDIDGIDIRVVRRPGDLLPPPTRGDVVSVAVRGTLGRYSPSPATLIWVENGTIVELTGSADLSTLLRAAASIEAP